MESDRYILQGTQANFDELVLHNSRAGLVAVDFWAPWAGPSLRQRELLMRAARQFGGRFLLVSINTDENPELSRRLNIRSLPLFKLYRHGREIETFHGVQPEADYPRIFERHLGGDVDPEIERALTLWRGGRRDQALQTLAEAAVQAPEEAAYPLLMVKLLIRSRRLEDAMAVLESLPEALAAHPELGLLRGHVCLMMAGAPEADVAVLRERIGGPEDADARFRLASRLVVLDNYAAALDELLSLARDVPEYRHGLPRQCLLALFQVLDDDELLARYRSALFQLEH